MSPAAVTSSKSVDPNPELTKALKFLATLSESDRKTARLKLRDPQKFPVPRTPAGGIAEAMEWDDMLEAQMERSKDDWESFAGRYYFSKIVNCFRKERYTDTDTPCDHGSLPKVCLECRFDEGNSAPGNAVEEKLQQIMENVYVKGKPGAVLKDMRISDPIEVECETESGETIRETIYILGKTDMLTMGDNFEVLQFDELKTPMYWPAKKAGFIKTHGKIVPLFLAGIEEPETPNGIVNINNAVQLAIGVQILRKNGLKVRKVALTYMNRERYREHVKILFNEEETKFLYDLGVWWTQEYHAFIRSGKLPPALFFMGWECRNCPFANRCTEQEKADGSKKKIHPAMVGLNARMAKASQH